MTDSLKPLAKTAPRIAGALTNDVSDDDPRGPVARARVREKFRRCIRKLGWSQLRAAVELDVAKSTIERWLSDEADGDVPGWALDHVRLLVRERFGADSFGRIKVSA